MTTFPRCANCGIPIRWEPTLVQGRPYCCTGCAQGGPCSCDYSRLPRRGEEAALVQMSSLPKSGSLRKATAPTDPVA